jgi:hypothetical protein
MWPPCAQIWVKMQEFTVDGIALKAACGINNLENFLLKILRFRLFIA